MPRLVQKFLILLAIFTLGCQRNATPTVPLGPQRDAELSAQRSGQNVSLSPSGIAMSIPNGWLERNEQFSNNLHLNNSELPKVCNGSGEWDTEYAQVTNEIFPFSRCVVHAGGEGWGMDSVSFADLQVRVYHLKSDIDEIQRQIEAKAPDSMKLIIDEEQPSFSGKPTTGPTEKINDWTRYLIRYGRFYHDYGGTANIDIRFRSLNSDTIAVVLMYTDRSRQRGEIEEFMNQISGFPAPNADGR